MGVAVIGALAVLGMSAQTVLAASFTPAQVATHNTVDNCWEIINGKVYDLTSFIPTHSGGQAVIIAQCGKDATAAFNSGPHSASTITALSGFMLGDLGVTPTPVPVPAPTPTPMTGPTTPSRFHHEQERENSHAQVQHKEKGRDENASHTMSSARLSRVSDDESELDD